jgi:hypothetical protein
MRNTNISARKTERARKGSQCVLILALKQDKCRVKPANAFGDTF